jgi:thioredoxin 1
MLHLVPLLLAFAGQAASQTTPPAQPAAQVQTAPAKAVKRAAPPPYNEKADAKAAIEAAVKAAATDDIRVLINWGANDDPVSKEFVDIRRAPELSDPRFFSDEYKVVNVDVGHLDRNLDLAKSYGVKLSAESLPAFTVLDAAGRVLANTTAAALRPNGDASAIDPTRVAAFLAEHQAPAPDAIAPFEAAIKQAKKEGKSVFVWFSAPW